jgi:hypothetical protein
MHVLRRLGAAFADPAQVPAAAAHTLTLSHCGGVYTRAPTIPRLRLAAAKFKKSANENHPRGHDLSFSLFSFALSSRCLPALASRGRLTRTLSW